MSKLKAITIKMAGQGDGDALSERVVLEPGAKVVDVIKKIGLPLGTYLIYDDQNLDPSSNLYDLVSEGDIINSSSNPDVGY